MFFDRRPAAQGKLNKLAVSLMIPTEGKVTRRVHALTVLIAIITVALEVFAMEGSALCQTSQRDLEALSNSSVIYVATVRKSGAQSKAAPVWFTVAPDHAVLIQTAPSTWKAKRIRRGSPVIVWIGKRNGPALIGKAEITKDSTVVDRIVDEFPKKYLMARLGFHRPTRESFSAGERVAIKIMPVRDLPEGFASNPGSPAPKI